MSDDRDRATDEEDWVDRLDPDELDLFRLAEAARRARLEDERRFTRRARDVQLGVPDLREEAIPDDAAFPVAVADAVMDLGAASDRLVTVLAEYADEPSITSTTRRRVVSTVAETVIAVLDAESTPTAAPDDWGVLPDPMLRRGWLLDWAARVGLRYQTAVCGAMAAAFAAAVAIAFDRLALGLALLGVFVLFDALDGGLARRDPRATPQGMYAASVASQLDDLVLIGGLAVWTEGREPRLALVVLGAMCLSMYAAFARSYLFQNGIRISSAWLERAVRAGGVGLSLALRSPWPAIGVLTVGAVTELGMLIRRARRQRIEKVLAFVLEHPRSTKDPIPRRERAAEWRHIVDRECAGTAAWGPPDHKI